MLIKLILALVFALIWTQGALQAAPLSLSDARNRFLQAEKYIRKNQESEYRQLERQLRDYPLYPYLHYQWLSAHLYRNVEIEDFLAKYAATRYAGLLRGKWLRQLAKDGNWPILIRNYRDSDDAALQCGYNWAKYNMGEVNTALTAAKGLWVAGRSQPDDCDALFKRLLTSEYFTRDMVWQRFRAALENDKTQLAVYVKNLLPESEQATAELWLKVHNNPQIVTRDPAWHRGSSQAGSIFAHAVDRISRGNSSVATDIWDRYKNNYFVPAERAGDLENKLAKGLAYRKDFRAYDRLNNLSHPDTASREWQIRTALREQDWRRVEESLAKLTEEEKKEIGWRYWLARTYDQNGRREQARNLYAQVAADRSFYGFVSAYKLNQQIQLNHQPVPIGEAELAALRQRPEFKMIAELDAIGRTMEAKRQWWYSISNMPEEQIMAAAKLAERWQWSQEAIFTIARAKYWDDMDLRFPIKYYDQVKHSARSQQLDPAIVYGLIRQESAFREDVRSPVGALGLMQIMPRTGQQIARELKERWGNSNKLLNPETNVRYGAFYYKKMLRQFDGHYALAAAAYNAGPNRVKSWLPEKRAVAADIWIETIPFKETRGYVFSVLTYALIYQQRLERNVLNIRDFMRDVFPG